MKAHLAPPRSPRPARAPALALPPAVPLQAPRPPPDPAAPVSVLPAPARIPPGAAPPAQVRPQAATALPPALPAAPVPAAASARRPRARRVLRLVLAPLVPVPPLAVPQPRQGLVPHLVAEGPAGAPLPDVVWPEAARLPLMDLRNHFLAAVVSVRAPPPPLRALPPPVEGRPLLREEVLLRAPLRQQGRGAAGLRCPLAERVRWGGLLGVTGRTGVRSRMGAYCQRAGMLGLVGRLLGLGQAAGGRWVVRGLLV